MFRLWKNAIFAAIAMGTFSLLIASLSADAIEVLPPPGMPPLKSTSTSKTVTTTSGTQSSADSTTGIFHHGKIVDGGGKASYCLQCHQKKNIRSHKILVPYPPLTKKQTLTYRSLQEVLALGMKFEDGMVTCISCHDLNNQAKYHIALESRTNGSAQKLCYICHLEIG